MPRLTRVVAVLAILWVTIDGAAHARPVLAGGDKPRRSSSDNRNMLDSKEAEAEAKAAAANTVRGDGME